MLNDEDINKIIEAQKSVFVTKNEFANFQDNLVKNLEPIFATKKDIFGLEERMNEKFSKLMIGMDASVKNTEMYFQEMTMRDAKVDRLERWLLQLAQKVDVKLEY